jgi:hypothetical protein
VGGPHSDTFNVDVGRDVLQPGDGYDIVTYRRAGGVTITLGGGADDGEAGEGDDVGSDAEQAEGGGGNDVLVANNLGNTLTGGGGNAARVRTAWSATRATTRSMPATAATTRSTAGRGPTSSTRTPPTSPRTARLRPTSTGMGT